MQPYNVATMVAGFHVTDVATKGVVPRGTAAVQKRWSVLSVRVPEAACQEDIQLMTV